MSYRTYFVLKLVLIAFLILGVVLAIGSADAALAPVYPWETYGTEHPWGMVTGDYVNFRTGPGMDFPSSCQRGKYSYVMILGAEGEWLETWYPLHSRETTLWVHRDYIQPVDLGK